MWECKQKAFFFIIIGWLKFLGRNPIQNICPKQKTSEEIFLFPYVYYSDKGKNTISTGWLPIQHCLQIVKLPVCNI